jgi:hypothetical protein
MFFVAVVLAVLANLFAAEPTMRSVHREIRCFDRARRFV